MGWVWAIGRCVWGGANAVDRVSEREVRLRLSSLLRLQWRVTMTGEVLIGDRWITDGRRFAPIDSDEGGRVCRLVRRVGGKRSEVFDWWHRR